VILRGGRALLVVASLAFCAAFARSARADDAAEQQAIEHHRKALELYDAGDVALALVEFERAYAANGNYKPLFNLGQIHFQLGHYAKARQALEKYLAAGAEAVPEPRRLAVLQDLAKLRLRTATVRVVVTPADAEVRLNDDLAAGATDVLVDAGTVRVKVDKEGLTPQTRELVMAGGEAQTLTLSLRAVDARPAAPPVVIGETHGVPPLAVAGWITASALLAGTVGVGIGALSASSRYEDNRTQPISTSPAEAKRDLEHQRHTVQALALTTDLLGAATLVTGALSLYLTVRHRPKRPTTPSLQVQGLGARFEVRF
jgi:hypothetical protein